METASYSETFTHIYQTKLHHIPDNLKINLQAYFAKLLAPENITTKTNTKNKKQLTVTIKSGKDY
jgi:hypothetical protein